jgi:hypothetical protein
MGAAPSVPKKKPKPKPEVEHRPDETERGSTAQVDAAPSAPAAATGNASSSAEAGAP